MRNSEAGSKMVLSVRVLLFDDAANAETFVPEYEQTQIMRGVSHLGRPSFSTGYSAEGEFVAVSEVGGAAGRIVVGTVARDVDKSWNLTGQTLYIVDDVSVEGSELVPDSAGSISRSD